MVNCDGHEKDGSKVPREPRHLKVTPEQYFAAALTRLAEQGADGLTISSLCNRLGVTSGSFYHYFGSWSGFVDALLAHWEDAQTQRIVELARATAHPMERLAFMGERAVALPHEAEAAIRAWGRSDDTVRAVVRRVDTRRHGELRTILVAAQVAPTRADELATMGMALMVGMQQLQRPVDTATLRVLFDELIRLARFHSRVRES
jgi:AcrR family transcriptional regulator